MATTIYGVRDDVSEEIPAGHMRISLAKADEEHGVFYRVEDASGDFYLCDADGDKLSCSHWTLLRVLADVPADDPDAFFAVIDAASVRLFAIYQTDGLTIKTDDDARLHMTTNAHTDELITPALYNGWTGEQLDEMRSNLIAEGMPEDLADRIIRQAEVWE